MSACSYDPDRTLETQLNALLNEYTLQRGFVEPRFIDLAEYVPQQWDTVHVIGHYAEPWVVHDALGFWWSHSWRMMGHDFYNLVVFVDRNDRGLYDVLGWKALESPA